MYKADSHNDFLIETKPTFNDIKKYLLYLVKNDVKYINLAFFTSKTKNFDLKTTIKIKKFINSLDKNKKPKILYSIEDMSFFNFNDFKYLKELNPITCGLTWNYENKYAGGAFSNGILSNEGKKLVQLLENGNILIDTAHLNKKSFYQVVDICNKTIINTHCGFDILKRHNRNLNNEQVKLIIEKNGYIGIALVGTFYDKRYKFNSTYIAQCISRIVDKFGIDHFGIGSDFFGTSLLPLDIKNYNQFSNLKMNLEKLGFKNKEIEKLFYKNFEEIIVNRNQKY